MDSESATRLPVRLVINHKPEVAVPQKNERFVGIYEMSVRPSRAPDAVAPISPAALELLRNAVLLARSTQTPISKALIDDKLFLIFDDMRIDLGKGYAAMLFTVADTDAADAVYRNVGSNVVRHFPKQRGEGGAASAHFVMKLTPSTDTLRYTVGLEDVEGVPRSRVLPFLQHCIQEYCGTVLATTDEGIREGEAILEIDSIAQDTITDAAGRPIGAQLIKLRPRRTLDPDNQDGFIETSRSVQFRIDTQQPIQEAIASLLRIREQQRSEFQNYPLMRIRWKRPDNRTQTLAVDGLTEDLLQRAFTRMELVKNIIPDMPASMIDIRVDFVDKIHAML